MSAFPGPRSQREALAVGKPAKPIRTLSFPFWLPLSIEIPAQPLLSGAIMTELPHRQCVCLLTGGAISNMYSVMAARYKHFPEVKTKGMAAVPRLVLFTSEHVSWVLLLEDHGVFSRTNFWRKPLLLQSHYSIKKAGAALGFGTDNVILIKCNER